MAAHLLSSPCAAGVRYPGAPFPRLNNVSLKGQRCRLTHLSPIAAFELRDPPYELDALEPHMSKETLEYHWGKHHRTYVEKLNGQIQGKDVENLSLEELVKVSYGDGSPLPYFNNAAQILNHDFFWESLKPGGSGTPNGEILELIVRDFGSYETFVSEFRNASLNQFGSGWVWLVVKTEQTVEGPVGSLKRKLSIEPTSNALNPIVWGNIPLLCLDVWEHAYYVDYRNRRGDFIESFLTHLISWEKVQERLDQAKQTLG